MFIVKTSIMTSHIYVGDITSPAYFFIKINYENNKKIFYKKFDFALDKRTNLR